MLRYLLVFALLCFSFTPAAAEKAVRVRGGMHALTKSMSFNTLVNSAGIIFKGRLLSIEYIKHKQSKMDARKMTFAVDDAIKGVEGDSFVAYEWAALASPFINEISPGETYVLFFNLPSENTGFTTLTGMEQGCVHLPKPEGEESPDSVKPKISARVLSESADLFGSMSSADIKGLQPLGATSTDRSPKNYSEFKELCNTLMK